MALNQLGLGFVFTAKDEATEVIERIKESFGELEHETEHVTRAAKSSFADFGKGLAIFAAGTALVGGAFELAEEGDKFAGMLEQAGAAANASAEDMEHMRDAALEIGLKGAGTSAAGAAEALRELVQEGYNATDAAKALGPTLDLVAISFGQISRSQAAGLVNDTLGEFRLGAEEAGPLVDKLALSVRSFGIRATELEPALRGVATGASLIGASLDDTLIALGLTKSVLPSVEQSARSVNFAFTQLASDHTRKELAAIGVQVTDSSGRMRPLIEILSDLNTRTARMSEAQREHALASIFSARAGGGLTAIMQALSNGMRDSSGKMVTGTAAIEELRRQMAGAAGTAGEMKARLLDTFEGQKKGLVASVQTVLQLMGEPFAEAFRPILSIVRRAFVAIGQFIAAIPEPMKNFLAKVTLAVGAVIALVGAVIAVKAGIALLGVGLQLVGITFGGVMATILPALGIFAALTLVVAGFAVAFQRDIGGIRTFFEESWGRIKLLFQGLAQLFSDGGFSGAVMKELDKAENAGVKQFAIRVFQIAYRIRRFFEGIAEGFGAALDRAQPIFESLTGALEELGEALGLIGSSGANAAAGLASDKFASAGAVIGEVLEKIVAGVVYGLAALARVIAGVTNGVREAFEFFRPHFQFVGEAIGFLADKISSLIGDVTGLTAGAQDGASVWTEVGRVIGWVAGLIGAALADAIGIVVMALGTVIEMVRTVIGALTWLGRAIGETAAQVYLIFAETLPNAFKSVASGVRGAFQPVLDFISSVVDNIHAALDRVIAFVGRLATKIPSRFRPAFLDSIVEAGDAAEARIGERTARAVAPGMGAFGQPSLAGDAQPTLSALPGVPFSAAAAGAPLPAASELRARGALNEAELDAIVARGIALSESRPLQSHVTLNVDGETLARVSARADRSATARAFVPVAAPRE